MTIVRAWLGFLSAGAALIVACSLNPQPLPPGDRPDAAGSPTVGPGGSGSGAAGDQGGADAGLPADAAAGDPGAPSADAVAAVDGPDSLGSDDANADTGGSLDGASIDAVPDALDEESFDDATHPED